MEYLKAFPQKATGFIFPDNVTERKLSLIFFGFLFIKFFLFNLIWCSHTTYAALSTFDCYLYNLLAISTILIPLVCFRAIKTTIILLLILDILFIVNLMYFRTYFSAIPLESYLLLDNLQDFTASVFASFRISDLGFPLTTLIPLWLWKKYYKTPRKPITASAILQVSRYLLFILFLSLTSFVTLHVKEGFSNAYDSHQKSSLFACRPPIYTIFGSLYYDYLKNQVQFTPEIEQEIENWLRAQPTCQKLPFKIDTRQNHIIILAESLESWVIEKEWENQEITPYLNALLQDNDVLYAPYVQSQVKGGRSIDGQLLINTGLLPIATGAFSAQFPKSYYPGLASTFREKYPDTKAYSITVDRQIVWNQCVVAPAFGYDAILDKNTLVEEEEAGPRKKVGDGAFLRQGGEKIAKGEVWSDSRHNILQLVTYSGHNPFKLPDELKRITFSSKMPEMLNDYMTMANYTDYAIGQFIEYLKSQDRYKDTMIIITGDHEGLADSRESLCQSEAGRKMVSKEQFIPFIVLNSPVSLRYEKVMGQVDIYPTLLDLMGLTESKWRGLGVSIFHPEKAPYAINATMQIIGETPEKGSADLEHRKKAWQIGDYIIRYNYLANSLQKANSSAIQANK